MNNLRQYYTDIRELLSFFNERLGVQNYIVFSLHLISTLLESFGLLLIVPMLVLGVKKNLPGGSSIIINQDSTGLIANFISSFTNLSGFSLLLILCALFLGKAVFLFLSMSISGFYRAKLYADLKHDIFKSIKFTKTDFLNTKNSGHLVNLFNEQILRAQSAYSGFVSFLTGFVSFIVYFGLLWLSSWTFAFCAIAIFFTLHFLFFAPQAFVKKMSRELVEGESEFNKKLFVVIHSIKYFKATNRFFDFLNVIAFAIESLRATQFKMGVAYSLTYSVREPIILFFLIISVYFELAILGHAPESLLTSILLLYRCASSAMSLQGKWQGILEAKGGIEVLQKEISEMHFHAENFEGLAVPNHLDITFKNVSFSHQARNTPLLRNLNFVIPHNSMIAFVGDSGSGKTTVLDLICMIYEPTAGKVLFNGIDSRKVNKFDFRNKIGYVTQDNSIFDGTIAENVAFGLTKQELENPEVYARINNAITSANLDEFVASLANGLETDVGDKGISLSGGQRQRLFIARELFREPQLLILDEATSAQDAESENSIQQRFSQLKGKFTTVVVSHRIASVKNADMIYVLENGKVAERGSFNDLIGLPSGIFAAMVMKQKI